jgi:cell division protein FtsZ
MRVVKRSKIINFSIYSKEKKEKKEKNSSIVRRIRIIVVGVGGGGGSIVSEISSRLKKASFLVANTDLQALKNVSRNVIKFPFGESLTGGLGVGMNWQLAQEAAEAEKERIKKILKGYDICIFLSCLGGGTGSGALPTFARIARNLGMLSYGIFTLPFKFEGERKAQIAREALEKLRLYLNAISIVPNEKIFEIVQKNTPLKIALSAINKNLADNLSGLIETIYEPGLINIDFADLRTILEGRGRLTYLNSVIISSLEKNEENQRLILSSPLYSYTIRGAKGILLNIVGDKPLLLSEVAHLSKIISDLASREAKIIFGIGQKKLKKDLKGGIKITLLATGCLPKLFQKEQKERTIKGIRQAKLEKTKKVKEALRKKRQIKKGKDRPEQKLSSKENEEKNNELKNNKEESFKENISEEKKIEIKMRRNALDLRKQIEEEEKEILEKEREWEIPPFLKREE